LHGRGSGGPGSQPRGSRLDIAMHDSTISLLEGAALAYLATGNAPPRIGNAHYSIAPFDTFQAKDRLFVICAANDELFALLCATVRRPELVEDPRFITNLLRHDNRQELKKELEIALVARPAATWLEIFEKAGVPCGPVSNIAEALSSEQAADRNLVIEVGGLRMPGNPMKFAGYPEIQPEPAPELDQQGEALRSEFGA
jgi:CoA:oxalate CoA-transferase